MNAEQEINAFINSLESAIDSTMENEVAEAGTAAIIEAVQSEVYDKYTPTAYIRRKENGGLADKRNVFASYDPFTKMLELENIAVDGETERLIAPVVESGVGYTWKHSKIYQEQPFPRPFHSVAEENLSKGDFENALVRGLKLRGFDIKK